ncbi:hypothetical protein [Photobacterium sp. TLY01]|nr:hypothetical protein [Photobacterium sp. TLY01]
MQPMPTHALCNPVALWPLPEFTLDVAGNPTSIASAASLLL